MSKRRILFYNIFVVLRQLRVVLLGLLRVPHDARLDKTITLGDESTLMARLTIFARHGAPPGLFSLPGP